MLEKPKTMEMMLSEVINSCSRENVSNTPDYILANYMKDCLVAFETASHLREDWYGVNMRIDNDWKELIQLAIGEASMCWSDIDKAGVFDGKRAAEIALKLLGDIKIGQDQVGGERP